MQLLSSLNRNELVKNSVFVTLTWPGKFPSDPATPKAQLRAFTKRLFRLCPHSALVWKLEYQSRGAPHFHLLVAGVRFLSHEIIARWWYEIVASHDPDHLAAGTETRAPYNYDDVRGYIGKYVSKVGDV